jgi:hypothetical protein
MERYEKENYTKYMKNILGLLFKFSIYPVFISNSYHPASNPTEGNRINLAFQHVFFSLFVSSYLNLEEIIIAIKKVLIFMVKILFI